MERRDIHATPAPLLHPDQAAFNTLHSAPAGCKPAFRPQFSACSRQSAACSPGNSGLDPAKPRNAPVSDSDTDFTVHGRLP